MCNKSMAAAPVAFAAPVRIKAPSEIDACPGE